MPTAVAVETTRDAPIVKRQKLSADVVEVAEKRNGARRGARSRIFAPFRTVGLVSPTDVPFTTVPLGKTTFQITTSVGRCLQTYDLKKGLNLVFMTRPQTPEVITAMTAWRDKVLAAWGGEEPGSQRGIWSFKRGKKVDELELPQGLDENINQLLVFGAWVIGCCSTRIEVWKSTTLEHYTTLTAPFSRHGGSGSLLTGGICNMPTYLNKILAGRHDGSVEIWNVSTGKLLYTILPAASDYGSVTALQPTPTLSLLAIAYSSGAVVIHNIRTDKEIISFNTGPGSKTAVSSISFRTDGLGAGDDGQKPGVMATACKTTGDVTFWDLNGGGRKMGILRGAHNPPSAQGGVAGGISKIEFLAGQAVLLTSGLDNSLKSWIFDETPFSPIPRILHSRSGHAAPVSTLQFLPSDADGADAGGKWLLSASRDRSLWGWSLRQDGQSMELSQGNIRKKAKKLGILSSGLATLDSSTSLEDLKAPRITCMACSLNRDGGMAPYLARPQYGAVPAKARGLRRLSKAAEKAGRWAFETGDQADVSSVAISPCGTFGLVGSAAGGIDMFNLQSGIHRQRFPARLTPKQAQKLKIQRAEESLDDEEVLKRPGKHTKAVTGIAVDGLNRTVVSCGEDGKVKFWEFATGLLLHEIDWYPMTAITGLRYHRPSDLIALSCDDSSIRIIDIDTKKLVRELWGALGRITDFCFSNDGRWIIAASSDSVVRVWDLPTGHLIDAIRTRSPCTALAFSNTGEYLATAQEDTVGVHVWTNRTLFTHVPTRQISDADIVDIDAPAASGEGGESAVTAALEDVDDVPEDEADETTAPTVDQLSEAITTLSLVPRPRWQTLLNLDLIRERNKPKEPPKPPEKAPFFLPSLQNGASGTSATSSAALTIPNNGIPNASSSLSRVSKTALSRTSTADPFTAHLYAASQTLNYESLITHLKTLSPAAADLAIRSLDPAPPYTELKTFVAALTDRLRRRRDYELVQAWMAVFLRLHGDVVGADEGLVGAVREWRDVERQEKERLGSLVGFCGGCWGG
ncbi:rRNA-processing protein utp21 [Coniosporium tulheliwenetii]|uniref:rRNA-processing protein utp21 n=1 Tax=Coniosporium tulheliwenetii TaxID=3383036 RepID=A0ACC2ZPL7_9PEZI|nr:rRNA-processing protein utp21 [Cladosporium sp. JES 115]